jgi:alpha-L-arabinofuranosidase
MPTASLVLDAAYAIGPVPRRLFGTFVEHMGRCVYTGLYEPGHPRADDNGLREDTPSKPTSSDYTSSSNGPAEQAPRSCWR